MQLTLTRAGCFSLCQYVLLRMLTFSLCQYVLLRMLTVHKSLRFELRGDSMRKKY